jgi:hypothetical protein
MWRVNCVLAVVAVVATVAGCKSKTEPKSDPGTPSGSSKLPGSGSESTKPIKPIAIPANANLDLAATAALRKARLDGLGFDAMADIKFCFAPAAVDPATIDPDRSLFVHDRATLDALGPDGFSLKRTLQKIADDTGIAGAKASDVFRDLWDTQNTAVEAVTADGAQCDDNGTTLNGFPNACRPIEGAQAKPANLDAALAKYRPVGLVNRLDLAAEGWDNCGEHRIVYGRQEAGIGRSFIIFEAVLPNPRPGCKSGCRKVAEHWYALSAEADPKKRAEALEKLFYTGLPGFRPVVHVDHYAAKNATGAYGGSSSGQIRTNQFLDSPWMLKEFKLALDCTVSPCKLDVVPIAVKANPDGNLWTPATVGLGNAFQQNVALPAVTASQLGADDLNTFSYEVPLVFDAGRSRPQDPPPADHYFEAYSLPGAGGFNTSLLAAAQSLPVQLSDRHIVNRAAALSCAGCHQPGAFGLLATDSISPTKTWPDSTGRFVHVTAEDQAGVHTLSAALKNVFLPARANNLAEYLSSKMCFCRLRKPGIDIARFEREIFPRPPIKLDDLRARELDLKRKVDAELKRQGKPALPDLEKIDLKPQRLILDAVRDAGADVRKRAMARALAVQKLVADEPPRKTVTGHFRAH